MEKWKSIDINRERKVVGKVVRMGDKSCGKGVVLHIENAEKSFSQSFTKIVRE